MKLKEKNQKSHRSGFTLIEILISLMMVVAAFGMLSHFATVNAQRIRQAPIEICEQTARNILGNIRSIGYMAANARLDRSTGRLEFSPQEKAKLQNVTAITNVNIDTDLLPPGTTNGVPYQEYNGNRNNRLAVAGTMTFLSNLYNGNRNLYCRSAQGALYSRFTGVETVRGQFDNVQTRIKIERKQLYNAASDPDCDDYEAAPVGVSLTPFTGYGTVNPADARMDSGYWVTINITYTKEGGVQGNCSSSALFHYPPIPRDPNMNAMPAFAIWYPGPAGQCNSPRPNARLTIQLVGAADRDPNGQGWVPMCQDRSSNQGRFSTSYDLVNYCNGRGPEGFVDTSTRWVRCDEVTACGKAKDSSQWSPDGRTLIVDYSDLPYDCAPQVHTYVFDMAGNATDPGNPNISTPVAITPNKCIASCNTSLYLPGSYCAAPAPGNESSVCTPIPAVPSTPPCTPPSCGNSTDGSSDGGSADGSDSGDGSTDGHDGGV